MNVDVLNCVNVLKKGGSILYPTDTIWGLGCDVKQPQAIDKIFQIKNIGRARSLIILIDSAERLSDCVENVPETAYDLLNAVDKPLTIIYPKAKSFAKNAAADDGSVGIRIVKHKFCQDIIKELGGPIVSTSANLTGEAAPVNFQSINPVIVNAVDYVVDSKYDEFKEIKASQIIKIEANGMFSVIRE